MSEKKLIPANEFCLSYDVKIDFIQSLHEYGIIGIVTVDDSSFIDEEELTLVEKMIRLHYELKVNMEGLDVICNLLNRIEEAEEEVTRLKNKLRFYELTT